MRDNARAESRPVFRILDFKPMVEAERRSILRKDSQKHQRPG